MSSQGWNFPAPPPPPPVAAPPNPPPPPPSQGYPPTNAYGHRGGRANAGQHRGRGRGRGDNSRGGRVAHHNPLNSNQFPPTNDSRFQAIVQTGYQNQHQAGPTNGYPAHGYRPPYPQQLPQYPQPPVTQPYFPQASGYQNTPSQTHPPQAAFTASYLQTPQSQASFQSYSNDYATQTSQPQSVPYAMAPSQAPQHPQYVPPAPAQTSHNLPNSPYQASVQPKLMGPPMRWGFDSQRSDPRPGVSHSSDSRRDGRSPQNQRDSRPNQHQSYAPRNNSSHRGNDHSRGQKRRHGDAFDRKDNHHSRPQMSPSVPSFGNPLPSKPPPPKNAPPTEERRNKKKNRSKRLKLGLTPKGEDRESSEEDDVDEETKLAASLEASGKSYEFSYRGNTSSLTSPEEIAAWIEERKKRYPTLARVAEAKEREKERLKVIAEARRAREEVSKRKRQERDEVKAKRVEQELEEKRLKSERAEAEEAAQKAKIKAEKLRRKLLKEQNRLANAEAEAERTRVKAEELKKSSVSQHLSSVEERPVIAETDSDPSSAQVNPFANFSKPAVPIQTHPSPKPTVEESSAHKPYLSPPEDSQSQSPSALSPASSESLSISESSEDPGSPPDDATSSSGSDDSAPEEASSRCRGEHREDGSVGAKRTGKAKKEKKGPCVHFEQGRCKKGKSCHYAHDIQRMGGQNGKSSGHSTEKGAGSGTASASGRKGLYQIMVEKELAERDAHVLNAIQYLGDRGVLDEPEPTIEGLPDPEISKATVENNEKPQAIKVENSPGDDVPIPEIPKATVENNEKPQAIKVENSPGDDVPVPVSPVREQIVDGLRASQS